MGFFSNFVALSALNTLATARLPTTNKQITGSDGRDLFSTSNGKIRGVNLGSQFIFESWRGESVWSEMGCGGTKSEFDCVSLLGQEAANLAFQKHWDSWITQDDIAETVSYGLNTIRVPVGYWLRVDLVYSDSEYFPQGGLDYVKRLCGWASDAGMYIIMDLHSTPRAQTPKNALTGQYASDAGFYIDYQYERALQFLEWMSGLIHSTNEFRNVRNAREPQRTPAYIDNLYYAAYDDHRYLKWDTSVDVSHDSYIRESCNSNNRDRDTPTISSDWDPSSNTDFYETWFAAQAHSYEKLQGWVFWNWKAQLNDYRWSYQDAVKSGVIPKDLNLLERVCQTHSGNLLEGIWVRVVL
ncbi:glucan endo-1-6-beta-glucosidase B [Penicillium canariense]|uniref:glucan endo-1,6-beta-glucosidase n=1 Tax=Penicillium canariense TaxID=189055 RepID=A0A9W9HM07_9EURO|nr:glucan endo-1-6-beta-glucosidase B [Penicillium canariense]KAJ5151275.1 glucan endo-1-6-beta-glucosidase B [Penicillium canariense]